MLRNKRQVGFLLAATLLPAAFVACGSSAADSQSAGAGDSSGRDPGTLHIAQIPSENAAEQAKANKALSRCSRINGPTSPSPI